MKRILLNLLAVLSLLLCVAVCVLWVRSASVNDWFRYNRLDEKHGRWTAYILVSSKGTIYVSYTRLRYDDPAAAGRYATGDAAAGFFHDRKVPREDDRSAFEGSFLGRRGIRLSLPPERRATSPHGPFVYRMWRALVPSWLLVLVFLTPALVVLARARRRRLRRRLGLCPACGYDLRATPGRCPECGTMVPGSSEP